MHLPTDKRVLTETQSKLEDVQSESKNSLDVCQHLGHGVFYGYLHCLPVAAAHGVVAVVGFFTLSRIYFVVEFPDRIISRSSTISTARPIRENSSDEFTREMQQILTTKNNKIPIDLASPHRSFSAV
ncbi:hypothetical protein GQX74_010162 [Glossina fuscipes]|nr:hypothetical protein GQX74_010162 [Glossina fuscipes]